jgi:imidazolonepropionase-like amidohydrolase
MRFVLLTLITLFCAMNLPAQDSVTVFTGAKIYPVSSAPIENGTLIIKSGKISAIGNKTDIPVPADAKVIDVSGRIIMPGLVDSHSHIGGGSGGDGSLALHPEVRILDAIDIHHPTFMKAASGGITTVNIMPGSGHLISGQTVYLKLRGGERIEDLLIYNTKYPEIYGGLKMANGTNSIREKAPFPGTRAKSASLVREIYVKAQAYKKKLEAAKDDPEKMPERDLQMEALVEVLDGKRLVHHHTHRHDDIITVLRLAEEFGFRVVLHHISEGWKVADQIAAAGAPCSIILIDSPGGKLEAVNLSNKTGAILEKAGADVAFHTDDPINDSRLFLRNAALAVREGMSVNKALEGLTLAGARMLDLDDRIGSLETGKDADLVLLSGDPLSVYTQVEQTWVEGKKVFDRSDPKDRRYAVGGYNVYRDGQQHVHRGGLE